MRFNIKRRDNKFGFEKKFFSSNGNKMNNRQTSVLTEKTIPLYSIKFHYISKASKNNEISILIANIYIERQNKICRLVNG